MCICSFACSCILLHIENVDKEYVAEAEDPDVEYLEEQQLQESKVAEEDRECETDFANPDLQQGKHRFMLIPESLHYI